MNSNSIYNNRACGIRHGDVFTKPEVVEIMLNEVGYKANTDLSNISIVEPSCGEGEFIVEIVKRLKQSSQTFHFDLNEAFHKCVSAYDIDPQKVEICRKRIHSEAPEIEHIERNIHSEDYLLCSQQNVDIVVGNPPYIRYEEIPNDKLPYYRKFSTFYYRADMYVLFFEKSLACLKPNGKHCFICSNRWMKNRYGKKLRTLIACHYDLKKIINMEGANAFKEEVLAYPAITLILNKQNQSKVKYADIKDISTLDTIEYRILSAPTDDDWSKMFNTDNQELKLIEEQGFKIGIGVATGADKIFIDKKLKEEIEAELLLPAINARDLSGDNMDWSGRYLLNPYDKNGRLIKLDNYPKAKAYLERHKEQLASRHKARKTPSKWYATIDMISPTLKNKDKILLPDISGNTFVFIDEGRYYPMHNIYYITGKESHQLKILAALLTSDFVRQQLSNLTNHMNGGYARWQSQYLRQLRIPNIDNIPCDLAKALLESYNNKNISKINFYTEKIIEYEKQNPSIKVQHPSPQQLTFAF